MDNEPKVVQMAGTAKLNKAAMESVAQEEEKKANLLLLVQGEILQKLLAFERFQAFLASNYEIKPKIDDTEKTVGFEVREFSPAESAKLVRSALEELQKGDQILIAQEADLKKIPKPRLIGKKRR